MSHGLLACGPYFDEGGFVASIVIFLLIKPLAYFAFVRAYRFRVSRAIPMRVGQAVKLAILRSVVGVVLVGGGAAFLVWTVGASNGAIAWMYLYVSRMTAWWAIGSWGASLRGRRLVGWVIFGTLLNVAFDVAVVTGLMAGWMYPTAIVMIIATFIATLESIGSRPSLQSRFTTDPLCTNCEYNLTGNLSGICPECGAPILSATVSADIA